MNRLKVLKTQNKSLFVNIKGKIVVSVLLLINVCIVIPVYITLKIVPSSNGLYRLKINQGSGIYIVATGIVNLILIILLICLGCKIKKQFKKIMLTIMPGYNLRNHEIRFTKMVIQIIWLTLVIHVIDFVCSLAQRLDLIISLENETFYSIRNLIRQLGFFVMFGFMSIEAIVRLDTRLRNEFKRYICCRRSNEFFFIYILMQIIYKLFLILRNETIAKRY